MKNTFCISRNQFSVREDTNQDGVSASLNFNENEITNTSFCTVRTWECLRVLYVLHGVLCVLHTYICLCTIRTLQSLSVSYRHLVCVCVCTLYYTSAYSTHYREHVCTQTSWSASACHKHVSVLHTLHGECLCMCYMYFHECILHTAYLYVLHIHYVCAYTISTS